MKHHHWIYKSDIDTTLYFGFIYQITNTITNVKYIGKKGFTTGGKNWKNYTSCCKLLNNDIKILGKDKFSFEIIELCDNKIHLSDRETYYQIKYDVLQAILPNGTRAFYNRNIQGTLFDMTGVRMSETTKNKLQLYSHSNHMYDSTIYEFVHKESGEVFVGTQLDFQKKTGISSADCVSILKGRQITCKKWMLSKNKNRTHGNTDSRVYSFIHKDGRIMRCPRIDFQKANRFHNVEVSQLINNKRKTTKGWSMYVS